MDSQQKQVGVGDFSAVTTKNGESCSDELRGSTECQSTVEELNSIDFKNRREEYSAVSLELQRFVDDAITNCVMIKESAKDALAVAQKRKDVPNDNDYTNWVTKVIINSNEVQATLTDVKEELHLAGQLLVENDEIIEEKWRKHILAEKRIKDLKEVIKNDQQKLAENEMDRINLEKDLKKTKAVLSRRASQILRMEQAVRLEQDKSNNNSLRIVPDIFSFGKEEISRSQGNHPTDVKTVEDAFKRLKLVERYMENFASKTKDNANRIKADKEILELRERCLNMEQQIDELNIRAKVAISDHTAVVQQLTNAHKAKKLTQELRYQELLDRSNEAKDETKMHIQKIENAYEDAQGKIMKKELELKNREALITQAECKIAELNQVISNMVAQTGKDEYNFSLQHRTGLHPVDDLKEHCEISKQRGVSAISNVQRILQVLQSLRGSHTDVKRLQDVEIELKGVREVLRMQSGLIDSLQRKLSAKEAANVKFDHRERSLAGTKSLLDLERRRFSTTTNPEAPLQAQLRRRSIQCEVDEQNSLPSTHDYVNQHNFNIESNPRQFRSQQTNVNKRCVLPGDNEISNTIEDHYNQKDRREELVRNDNLMEHQQKRIYDLQQKLENLSQIHKFDIDNLKRQLKTKNGSDNTMKEGLIKSEISKWKEKYWNLVYNGQKQEEKYAELQEELEETRKRYLEASSVSGTISKIPPEPKNGEYGVVKKLLERVSADHSDELQKVEKANKSVIDQLETKVELIVQEKNLIASDLAEKTHQLDQLYKQEPAMQYSITQLQSQLEETQFSLKSKREEVSELKKEHEEILSELKKSKLHFIKQSVVEIERLKSVIRVYNKRRTPASSHKGSLRSWLGGWV